MTATKMSKDDLFLRGNKELLNNQFDEAISTYSELLKDGRQHTAVAHNLAIAYAMHGNPTRAMELLDLNMQKNDKYVKSFMFAAELYRRASRGNQGVGAELLAMASKMLVGPLNIDRYDPQTCIVASDILGACENADADAIQYHINALAAIKARTSKRTPNFVAAFMDNIADEALHYFSMPPEDPVTTGSLPPTARDAGKCLVVIDGQHTCPPPFWQDWPVLRVTYGAGPRGTSPGHIHVRTEHKWAASFEAARFVLDVDIPTSVVCDPGEGWPRPELVKSEALLTVEGSCLSSVCMKPASMQELYMCKELFNPQNVLPSRGTAEMALATFEYLTKDSCLDVAVLPEDSDNHQGGDDQATHSAIEI